MSAMVPRIVSRLLLAGLLIVAMGGFARSAEQVDLQLVLAVDVSGSVDYEESQLQRQGYHEAFAHPRVLEAIQHGFHGRIAVTYFEWAGYGHNRIIADWMVIEDEASAAAFRAVLQGDQPRTARRTSISQAIEFGVERFEISNFESRRRVIDISGDGPNNWGRRVDLARDEAVKLGITINGLPIVNNRPSRSGRPQEPNLDLYYKDCVIGGPSAFIVVALGFADFARAVRRKLILEIAGTVPEDTVQVAQTGALQPGILPPIGLVQNRDGRTAPPCNLGERIWQDRQDY